MSQTIKCELGSDEPGGAVHMGASCKGIPADLGPGLSGVTPRALFTRASYQSTQGKSDLAH